MKNRIVNILTGTVAMLTLAIGAGAFLLSYDALKATGQAGGIPPALAWLWPLLIDAPLIVFTLALLIFQIMRQSAKLWAGLVILYTLATVGFNLSHAQPTPLGWTVAVVAPVGLLLTTEALRHLAKTIIERAAAVQNLAELLSQIDQQRQALAELLSQKQGEIEQKGVELDKVNGQIEIAQQRLEAIKTETKREISANVHDLNAARQVKIEQRRASVLSLLGQGLSESDIAGELGVTTKTIRRDIQQLNGAAQSARGTK